MAKKNRSILLALVAVFVIGLANAAHAGLLVDVRFSDGSKSKTAVAGQDYGVQVWAEVTGTDGNTLNEGMSFLYTAIQSHQVQAGVTGAVSAFTVNSAFQATGFQPGVAADFNGDGNGDWGTNASDSANNNRTNYVEAIATANGLGNPNFGNTNGVTANQITGGYEFLIGTGTVHVSAVSGGELDYNVIQPTWTTANPKWSTYSVDGTSTSSNSSTNPYSLGTAIQLLTVPEPASMGLMALGSMGLLSLRRRRNQ